MEGRQNGKRFLGARLAFKDVRHEWKLSLCMILAISAVLAPLMILFGLKYGTIDTMRQRLVDNPSNLALRPKDAGNYSPAWFKNVARRAEVAFIVPDARQIATNLYIRPAGFGVPAWIASDLMRSASGGMLAAPEATIIAPAGQAAAAAAAALGRKAIPGGVRVDIVPTGPGDPLILKNKGSVPGPGQCVLSRKAAEILKVKPGAKLVARVSRAHGRAIDRDYMLLTVKSILDPRATRNPIMYLRQDLVQAVENYKDGRAVAALGWPGAIALADPRFDGYVLWFKITPSRHSLNKLKWGTGLLFVQALTPASGRAVLGTATPAKRPVFLLSQFKVPIKDGAYDQKVNPVLIESRNIIFNKLSGYQVLIIPWVRPLQVTAVLPNGRPKVRLFGLSAGPDEIKARGGRFAPPWGRLGKRATHGQMLRAVVPAEMTGVKIGDTIRVAVPNKGAPDLIVPLLVVGRQAGLAGIIVPSRLMGLFRTARLRALSFDPRRRIFLYGVRNYASFRLYAKTIDDVPKLVDFFERDLKTAVTSRLDEIRQIQAMDSGLTKVFWLVALVGIAGGLASLIASLLATVERKKRDLSVLRLMGMSGWEVLSFPIANGVYLALGGAALAIVFFYTMAFFINRALEFRPGEKLCVLPVELIGLAVVMTLAVAGLASLFAAARAATIEPAEALRDE
jgi:putative ABC transport system permease protein